MRHAGTAMDDLGREIRRLAEEIRHVEEILVEAYGLAPVTPAVAAQLGSAWVRRWRALYRRAHRSLVPTVGSSDMFRVRAPQPD